jgi:thioredoxin reductase
VWLSREQLAEYPTIGMRSDQVVGAGPLAGRFAVSVEGRDARVCTRALVIAHGLRYDPPSLPGIGDGRLERIEFTAGPEERRDALFVCTPRGQPNDLAAMLSCSLSAGDTIETDIDGRTGVPGVYAAGTRPPSTHARCRMRSAPAHGWPTRWPSTRPPLGSRRSGLS